MRTNILKSIVGLAVLMFTSFMSYAQNERPNKRPEPKELIEKMDEDKDGKLSKEEVKGPLKNDFSKIDTDSDGFLTEEELKNAPKPQRPQNN